LQPTLSASTYAGITINGQIGARCALFISLLIGATNWKTHVHVVLPTSRYLFVDQACLAANRRPYRATWGDARRKMSPRDLLCLNTGNMKLFSENETVGCLQGNRQREFARLAIVGVAIALYGCGTTQQPISTSLLDITGESRVTKLKSRDFPYYYTLFEQHEAFSVNGMLQMPDVGQEFYLPGKGDPTSAIGIAVAQSYKLIGESEIPSPKEVEGVRTNLDEVQFWTLRLVALSADVNSLRAQVSTNQQTTVSTNFVAANIMQDLNNLLTEQTTARSNLLNAQTNLRGAIKPGIIIARWQAKDSNSASAKAGSVGNLSYSGSRGKGGFVVLGGIRFVSVVYGEDFWWLLNNLRPHEKEYVRNFGVVTYLIQASNLAYGAEMDLNRVFKGAGSYSGAHASIPTSAEVEAAIEQLAHFGNAGDLGHITWKREPFCFVCGIDLPDLAVKDNDRVIQKLFNAEKAWKSPINPFTKIPEPSFQGWRTVVAKVTHVGWFPAHWPLCGKKVWEYYNEPRHMRGAPTCPVCGRTNAYIEGLSVTNLNKPSEYTRASSTNAPVSAQ
jgi:hypothetical protein